MAGNCRYSPVAPLPLLRQLQERDLLGNYLLFLAHDVLEHPQEYSDLVANLGNDEHAYPKDKFIIMDNGVIELGTPLSAPEIQDAAHIVYADTPIMPDFLGSFEETQKRVIVASTNIDSSWMRVPQGSNLREVVSCIDWLHSYLPVADGEPEYWGVPRWITNQMGSRIPIVQYINHICANPKIHLLGMSTNMQDDLRCCTLPDVIGIDSANPLTLGIAGINITVGHSYGHPERGNYWDATKLWDQSANNVAWMHDAVGI